MCGCQLSLYGHIALAPAGDFDFQPPIDNSRLETGTGAHNISGEFQNPRGRLADAQLKA